MAATRLESKAQRAYPDFRDHLDALDRAGLLFRVDEPIDKDAEMHPLVRWQFRGGLKEEQRKAFLFTDVTDAKGRRYDMPVAIGALAANADIYGIGMGAPVGEIGNRWNKGHRESRRAGRSGARALPGGRDRGRRVAGRGEGARCASRPDFDAGIRRGPPISPPRGASPGTPRPGSRTWGPTGRG